MAYNFENKKIGNNVTGYYYNELYTRYIASYIKAKFGTRWQNGFGDWLESIGISDQANYEIMQLIDCGKMELQDNARNFINEHSKNDRK